MLASKRDIDTKFTITIERILFIILLHAIIPSIFIIIYLNLGQREAARKTFENNLVQITQFAAHSFEKEFLKTKAMLQVLSSLPEIRAHNKKACEEISRTLLNADTDQVYTTIGAIDKTGNIYCNPVPLAQKINVSDRDYFQQVSKNQRFTTGGYSIGRLSGSKLIVAAYPIFDKNETFDGMVGAAMDVRWLEKIAEKVKLPPGYTFTTIDQNGIIVARHPYVENLIGTDSKQRALGKAIFSTSQKEGIFTATGLDNTTRLYTFTAIENSMGDGTVYVAIGAPISDVEEFANQHAIRDILTLVGVILAAVIICAFDLHYFLFRRKPTLQ